MNNNNNASAVILTKKPIAKNVKIGPWSVIGPDVTIGEGTEIGSHVVINGPTTIGKRCKIYSFASVGGYYTRIGNNNLFMAYVHIAHDCIVGNNNVFSNNASLAGHAKVGNNAILSGFSGLHQFCRRGDNAFLGMRCCVSQDVAPYTLVAGAEGTSRGLNLEGLKRHGFSKEVIMALKQCYKIIFRQNHTLKQAIEIIKDLNIKLPEITNLVTFLQESERGIVR